LTVKKNQLTGRKAMRYHRVQRFLAGTTQSRGDRRDFMGLAPPNKALSPSNWHMKR